MGAGPEPGLQRLVVVRRRGRRVVDGEAAAGEAGDLGEPVRHADADPRRRLAPVEAGLEHRHLGRVVGQVARARERDRAVERVVDAAADVRDLGADVEPADGHVGGEEPGREADGVAAEDVELLVVGVERVDRRGLGRHAALEEGRRSARAEPERERGAERRLRQVHAGDERHGEVGLAVEVEVWDAGPAVADPPARHRLAVHADAEGGCPERRAHRRREHAEVGGLGPRAHAEGLVVERLQPVGVLLPDRLEALLDGRAELVGVEVEGLRDVAARAGRHAEHVEREPARGDVRRVAEERRVERRHRRDGAARGEAREVGPARGRLARRRDVGLGQDGRRQRQGEGGEEQTGHGSGGRPGWRERGGARHPVRGPKADVVWTGRRPRQASGARRPRQG